MKKEKRKHRLFYKYLYYLLGRGKIIYQITDEKYQNLKQRIRRSSYLNPWNLFHFVIVKSSLIIMSDYVLMMPIIFKCRTIRYVKKKFESATWERETDFWKKLTINKRRKDILKFNIINSQVQYRSILFLTNTWR